MSYNAQNDAIPDSNETGVDLAELTRIPGKIASRPEDTSLTVVESASTEVRTAVKHNCLWICIDEFAIPEQSAE